MKKLLLGLLALSSVSVFADPPAFLVVDNDVGFSTNAFVNGQESKWPVGPHETRSIPWPVVQALCANNNPCTAEIKKSNTPALGFDSETVAVLRGNPGGDGTFSIVFLEPGFKITPGLPGAFTLAYDTTATKK